VVALPSGTVTFLFTDLEGSTRLWEEHPDAMGPALARHDELLRSAIEAHGGQVVKTTGDGFHAVFATARDAVGAAVAMQLGLGAESFAETGPLRVRMGVHTCEAEYRDGDYYGSEVNRAARLMGVAHGGQVVVSSVTAGLVRGHDVELVDLGEHRLRDLAAGERVFQVSTPGLAVEFPPLRSLDVLPGNLPRQVTTFVGREAEIASIAKLLRTSSLVTLTGVGGVGKTRLSLEVAAEVVPEFSGGAWCCEFAPVADPDAVWETVAAPLRVQPFPGRSLEESVLEYLSEKRLLLVLDNCEHLLGAIARLVDAIQRRCERVAVLATSREGLGVAGERMVAVPSLGVPADDAEVVDLLRSDATRLFEDRANAAKADFVLTDQNAGAVGELCRRLDGIPLAIELAAARVRSMSPDDLVARLDQRFKLLTKGSRAALARQQTLRATIDWSYDLLDPTERLVLDRMSVFAGGCDLAAAEAVLAGDDLDAFEVDDVLGQLVDKSLVVADDTDQGVRYRLLETIRQYAQEQLEASGDGGEVRRRHADHYAELVEAAGPHLAGLDQQRWTDSIRAETDNLHTVLDWAIETESPEHALRLVAPLPVASGVDRLILDWAPVAVSITGAPDHPLFPEAACWASLASAHIGDYERAEELLAAAEQSARPLDRARWHILLIRTTVAFFRGHFEQGCRWAAEAVQLARTSADPHALVSSLVEFGTLLTSAGRVEDAVTAFEEAVRLARDGGLVGHLANALCGLARDLPPGESERAIAMTDEALEIATRLDDHNLLAAPWEAKARIAARFGDWPAVLRANLNMVEQHLEFGDVVMGGAGLRLAARALIHLGDLEAAAVAFGAADAIADRGFAPVGTSDKNAATEAALIDGLGEQRAAELAARGAAMTFAAAVTSLHAAADRILTAEAEVAE
jgi:predicted ATPase/class 3 adenylate cyclase